MAKRGGAASKRRPPQRGSAAAAAAQNQQRNDNQPDPVVVKEVAQAVAVHNRFLRIVYCRGDFPSALLSYVASAQMFAHGVKKSRGEKHTPLWHLRQKKRRKFVDFADKFRKSFAFCLTRGGFHGTMYTIILISALIFSL